MSKFIITIFLYLIIYPVTAQELEIPQKWKSFIHKDQNNRFSDHPTYYLIQFDKLNRNSLNTFNIEIIRVLDDNHAIVWMEQSQSLRKIRNIKINSIYTVNNEWKLSENIDPDFDGKIEINIVTRDEQGFEKEYSSLSYKKVFKNSFRVLASAVMIKDLIKNNNIIHIALSPSTPFEEAALIDYNFTINTINVVKKRYPTLNGEDLTVSVKEDEYRINDLDLISRHIDSGIGSGNESPHATDMATIIAGGGNTAYTATGVAPLASITSSSFLNLFPDPIEKYEAFDISLQNHSYGVAVNNEYTPEASAYDEMIHENSTIVHVFSSGNFGTGGPENGTYSGITGFANLTGGFKMAKNIITVGAVDSLLDHQQLVSRGPAYDGRVKPELVAYSQTGSSASAAIVSGTTLLLQEFYQEKFSTLPNVALLKAALLNSADDLGEENVDYTYGFGNLNAYEAVKTIEEERIIEGSVNHDETFSASLEVPANVKTFKITITWLDPPAMPNTSKALINDLDLTVNKDGQLFLPWVLNSYPHIDSLTKPAERGVDHLNNVEQITITNPDAGTYDILVNGYDIAMGTQQFFIAYEWEFNDAFSWTYPVGGDNLPYDGERVKHLRWNTTMEGTGSLFYDLNNTGTWTLVDDEIPLSKEYYFWNIPDTFSLAKIKMVINQVDYTSEDFVLSSALRVKVGFNCQDSVMFTWNKSSNASGYGLYKIEDNELINFGITSDTSVVLYKNSLTTPYFAVSPLFGSFEGYRSLTYDYNLQGVDCYISSFLVNETDNNQVELILSLGSSHKVDEVVFEKLTEEGFITVESIEASNNITFQHIDATPNDGINTYRARIAFEGQQEIYTDEYSLYVLYTIPYVIYPNPLNAADEYLVLHLKEYKYGEAVFTLFNHRGQLVFEEYLLTERSFIDLVELSEGIYFYHLRGPGLSDQGKIIVKR